MSLPETISTERLLLRPPRLDDAEALYYGYGTDLEVVRYLTWKPSESVEQARDFLRSDIDNRSQRTSFSWAITIKPEDRLVGMIAARPKGDEIDFGYVLARAHWGKGYMTEALKAMIATSFANPLVNRVWAVCDIDNNASAAVMRKAGMRFSRIIVGGALHPNISDHPRDVECYEAIRDL
ncbi:MAG: GNAT family N-acetyltransferase [Candidatus Sumerlaeota bacterium]